MVLFGLQLVLDDLPGLQLDGIKNGEVVGALLHGVLIDLAELHRVEDEFAGILGGIEL